MAVRILFSIDDKCLAFSALFMFINFIALRGMDNFMMKLVVSTLCLFFLFSAFVLDAWLSYVKDEEWKTQNLTYKPTEYSKEENTKND